MKIKLLFFILFLNGIVFSQDAFYYFKDASNTLDIETIANKEFSVFENEILEKHSNAAYWFKIPAKNTSISYLFTISNETINAAEAYQNNLQFKRLKNQRYISYQFSRESDVYIKVNPTIHAYIPAKLQEVSKAVFTNKKQLLLNGFYYGFTFLVILYNLIYYFVLKDDAFLYYALFLTTIAFGLFIIDGMLNLFETSPQVIESLFIIDYVLLAYFSSRFTNSFLFIEIYFPKLKRIAYVIGTFILVMAILYLTFKEYKILFYLNVSLFSLLTIYWSTSVFLFNKNIYTKIFAIGYVIILFFGIDFFILKFFGVSLIKIQPLYLKFGSFLEMTILSIAVLYRMKILKQENKHMRNEIIQYSKEIKELTLSQSEETTKGNIQNLTIREREIFEMIVSGSSNKDISLNLNISLNTVKFHLKNIYDKLNIKSRREVFDFSIN